MSPSNNQIQAIHWLLIKSRNLAYSETDSKKLASILDSAEYLVSMWLEDRVISSEHYSTPEERFRYYLKGLEERHPELRGMVNRFDG